MELHLKNYLEVEGAEGNIVRDKILLCRRVNPKTVNLTGEQSFYAGYKRVSRWNLPRNISIRQARAIRGNRGNIEKKELAF